MRILTIIALTTLFGNFTMIGQHNHHICGTSEADQHVISKGLQENQRYLQKHGADFKSLMPTFVPIKFHLIAESDGAGRLDFSSVINQMSIVNTRHF